MATGPSDDENPRFGDAFENVLGERINLILSLPFLLAGLDDLPHTRFSTSFQILNPIQFCRNCFLSRKLHLSNETVYNSNNVFYRAIPMHHMHYYSK